MMKREPVVSIVCTNYNKGDWIRDALDSFLAQKLSVGFEVIIIDDASTDGSTEVIREYAEKYPQVIRAIFNEKNLGITRTWIKVCKTVRGKYIARCDGDDFWFDDLKIQKQLDVLKANPDSQWSNTDFDVIMPDGKVTDRSGFESGIVKKAHTYEDLLATRGFTMASTWLVDADLMRKVNDLISEDTADDTFDIQLELFRRTTLSYLPESTTTYRTNYDSDSSPEDLNKARLRNDRLLNTQLDYIERYKDVNYADLAKASIRESADFNIINIELKHALRVTQKENAILENKYGESMGIIDDITNSRTYRIVSTISSLTKLKSYMSMHGVKVTLKQVAKRTLFRSSESRRLFRRWSNINTYRYQSFYKTHFPSKAQLSDMSSVAFPYRPLISIIMPTYDTPEMFLREAIESVKSQVYENWELIVVDDASPDGRTREIIDEYADNDTRIIRKYLKKNRHIAGATNEGIKAAKGEFVSLFDHDDLLWPNTLHEITSALNKDRDVDFIYTDEDKVDQNSRVHFDPFFKPDWNPDLLRSVNYITHFTTIRKSVLDMYGYEDGLYNGAQDWELFLRITRNLDSSRIHHIPMILYSWRSHIASTAENGGAKPYVKNAQELAVLDDLKNGNQVDGFTIYRTANDYITVVNPKAPLPSVTIIINVVDEPTLKSSVASLLKSMKYRPLDVILLGSDNVKGVRDSITDVGGTKVYRVAVSSEGYAQSFEAALKRAGGELLVITDQDVSAASIDDLEVMYGYAKRNDIAFVLPKVVNMKSGRIVSAGARIQMSTLNSVGLFARSHLSSSGGTLVQSLMKESVHNKAVVPSNYLVVEKSKLAMNVELKGIMTKDGAMIDLSLSLWRKGIRSVYLPQVSVDSHSKAFYSSITDDHRALMDRHEDYLIVDPVYNRNLRDNDMSFRL